MTDQHDGPKSRPAESVHPHTSLTHKAARGFAFFILQTAGVNLANLAQLVVLGQILSEEEWGLGGMVTVVASVLMSLQASGVNQLLVQRHKHFRRWANAGFWVSLTMGLAAGGLFAISAPFFAWWYEEPRVVPLILVLACVAPMSLLAAVPSAQASGQLRFKMLAVVNFCWYGSLPLLSIVLALRGWGAMSFVLPRLIADPVRVALMWAVTRPPVRWNPQFRRWRYIIPDSFVLLGGSQVEALIQMVELFILGKFHSALAVGPYQFAFRLSRQPLQVLTGNLVLVLFPALSTLQHDPKRQVAAFLRAAKVLAIIGIPVCFALAALAEPGLKALFGDKWDHAVPILVALSLGMAIRLVGEPAHTVLKAQGRFKTILWMNIGYLVPFVAATALAAKYGSPLTVGIVVGIFSSILGPAFVYVSIRPGGGRKRDVAWLYLGPLAASAAAVAGGWGLGLLVPGDGRMHEWIRVVVISVGCVVLYVPLVRLLAADAWKELFDRVQAFRSRPRPLAPAESGVEPA